MQSHLLKSSDRLQQRAAAGRCLEQMDKSNKRRE
jgi:hypothetical protein